MIKRLSHNGWLKVLSIALAIILWVYVSVEEEGMAGWEVSRSYGNIEINVRNLSNNLVLAEDPGTVDVTLRGTQQRLDRVDEEQLMVFIDLEGLEAGTHTVPVEHSVPQFDVGRIHPAEVEVTLEEKIEREMPVEYRVEGTPAEGLEAESPQINPELVVLTGAQSYIDQVYQVVVDINVQDALEEVEESLVVELEDEDGLPVENVDVSPGMVEVFVPMTYPQVELEVVPLIEDDLDDYYLEDLEVIPATITAGGWESVIQDLETINTNTVYLSSLLEQETVVVGLDLLEGIKTLSEESVAVTGQVSSAEQTSFDLDLQINEALEARGFTSQQEEIRVTLSGASTLMGELTKEDLLAYVSLDDAETIDANTKEIELPVNIDLPDNAIEIIEKAPEAVVLTR